MSIETNVNCLYQPTQSASLKKYWNLHMPTVSFTEAKVTRENVQISVQYEVECRQIQYLFGSDQTKKKEKKKNTQAIIDMLLKFKTSSEYQYHLKPQADMNRHTEKIHIHRQY